MIDVIFLLLVFFIYAMVLMVGVDLVPMELQLEPGTCGTGPGGHISIDLEGQVFLDRTPIELEDLASSVQERTILDPRRSSTSRWRGPERTDRAPVLQDVWDRLGPTGVAMVGRPRESRLRPPFTPRPVGPGGGEPVARSTHSDHGPGPVARQILALSLVFSVLLHGLVLLPVLIEVANNKSPERFVELASAIEPPPPEPEPEAPKLGIRIRWRRR